MRRPDHALRVLDRDPPLALLHEDDAAITARARNGIMTFKTWSGFVDQPGCSSAAPKAIMAKIISEMPLPIPPG